MKTRKIILAVLTAAVLSTALCACGNKETDTNTELGSIDEDSTQNGYQGNDSTSAGSSSESKNESTADSNKDTSTSASSEKDNLEVSNESVDFINAEKGDVLVTGDIIVNINGFSFNIKDDYSTVVRPGLEALGLDMDAAEASQTLTFTNKSGYSRQVEFNVQEVNGVKAIKSIAYGIPDEGKETDKEFEDSIMSINGYKSSEATEFAAQLGVGRNGKVFVNDKSTYLIVREGTLRVYMNN